MRRFLRFLLVGIVCLAPAAVVQAHFIWLVPEPKTDPPCVQVYFGETAEPDDPELLKGIADAEAFVLEGRQNEPKQLTLERQEDSLTASLPGGSAGQPVVLRHTYGVIERGQGPMLLTYFAKAYSSPLPGSWNPVENSELLPLEITPLLDGTQMKFRVTWQGKPAAGSQVTVNGPGLKEHLQGETGDDGIFQCQLPEAGLYSVRARVIDETSGEREGKTYQSARYYSTLTFPSVPSQVTAMSHEWPALPQGTTSFGGAIAGDWLYVYGGHYGQAHHYSTAGQSGDFRRLNLRQPGTWEQLAGGPKLTGLALVEYKGDLYRLGGFTALNAEGEPENLASQSDFARYRPGTGAWEALPPLPEGRSSHDAALVGDRLYVVGGWKLQGDEGSNWHETAWSADLSVDPPRWEAVPPPPFHRRAVALAGLGNKLYVLGGMQEEGGPTTRVAVYDPQTRAWSEGPALLGTGMDGFGSAAFACRGRLYATTMSGSIQRLNDQGDAWEYVGQLDHPRFFHRLLPWNDSLVIVGGASMATGKIVELERIAIPDDDLTDRKAALRNAP